MGWWLLYAFIFLIYRVCTRNTNMNMAETTGKFAGLQKLSVPTIKFNNHIKIQLIYMCVCFACSITQNTLSFFINICFVG